MKTPKGKVKVTTNTNAIPMLNQFHPKCHPYILDVIDVKADGHCGFRAIASLLGDENQIKEAFINGGRGHPPSHLKFFLLVFSKLKEEIK